MSDLDKSTVRPGLLVSLKTVLQGNVKYLKTELEEDHPIDDGGRKARWETERTIANAQEHEDAVKVRGRCRTVILSVCAKSNFGFLCSIEKQKLLEEAVIEARRLAENFNATSSLSKIGVFVLVGELVANEVEAARAINFEVRGLIDSMEQGIKRLDVKQIRDAALRAKNLGSMLTDSANEKLDVAIKAARKVATAITKQGEVASSEIDQQTITTLADARTAFLDLDAADDLDGPVFEAQAPEIDLEEPYFPGRLETQIDSEFDVEDDVPQVREEPSLARELGIDLD